MSVSIDSLLERRVGSMGKWHYLFFITLVIVSHVPMEYYPQMAFLVPQHYCHQPQLANLSWNHQEIINLSIPYKSDPQSPPMIGQAFQPCKEYDLDALWPHMHANTSIIEALALRDSLLPNLTTRACSHGTSFDHATAKVNRALGVEFQIVCDWEFYIPLSTTIYIIGMFVGSLAAGPLADSFGRRKVSLTVPLVSAACGIATALAPDPWTYLALRFFTAVLSMTTFVTHSIFMSEWLTASQRNAVSLLKRTLQCFFGRGFLVLCVFLMPSWRSSYAFFYVTTLPVISGYWLWLESPRWLLAHGRTQEAWKGLLQLLRWNGRTLSEDEAAELKEDLEELAVSMAPHVDNPTDTPVSASSSRGGGSRFLAGLVLTLKVGRFRSPFLLLCVMWTMHTFFFYGVNFNAVRLEGNALLIAFLTGMMILPATVLQYLVYRWCDRKRPLVVLYAVAALLLLIGFIFTLFGNRGTPTVAVATIGLIVAEALFTMLYLHTPELFPTSVRVTILGLCAAVARVGMIAGAYVERLDELVWMPLPMLAFCIASAIAALSAVFLPASDGEMEEWEVSINKALPDDVDKKLVDDNEQATNSV